ncbi:MULTISPECIES: dUTP diphosphatase [Brevibacillus]|uniref:dUTP diphosphatase n=1 Tax=Brevibacillus TaxID=55080 RepID=UPI0004F2A57D|nr:dUTP diphosphatase [Brevibacillus borstelensis]KKX52574.1 deoxyuridine 5'-triphosphate nucleotidohydrolase [Brevibacillus borstelensis cifa_chp40]
MNISVKIKRLHPDAVIPSYAKPRDAGFDLVAVEDTIIRPGETAKVRTGLAMALPPGYELQIRPRSGVSAKTKLRISNAPGTIDSGYRGEICILVDNINQMLFSGNEAVKTHVLYTIGEGAHVAEEKYPMRSYFIPAGTRIAQGVLAAVPMAEFEETNELDETDRGIGGFGSTGTK